MTREQIVERMAEAFTKVTEQTPPPLTDDLSLKEGLGLDSFSALELLFELEESLDLRIPQEQSSTFKTVGDVIAFAQGHARTSDAPDLERASS